VGVTNPKSAISFVAVLPQWRCSKIQSVPGGRSRGGARRSAWRIPGITALTGHVLLVPVYFVARWWELSRQPFGFDDWPGEPGWPAGSGSSEWRPGEMPLFMSSLLLWTIIFCACLVAGLIGLARRRTTKAGE
jgi:hypothetical protein